MIINVNQPVFVIDINNPEKIYYGNIPNGKNFKTLIVQTFTYGVPTINNIKEGEILYKYNESRGAIFNTNPNKNRKKWINFIKKIKKSFFISKKYLYLQSN